jgi:TRAP-type mannitol/chloroaromatic compound transport system permease small subunit
MKPVVKLLHVIDRVSIWSGKIISWGTLVLMGAMAYEVVMRYVFNAPTIWSLELGTYLFTAIWLFSGAWTHQFHGHIKVDIIYERLSKRGKAIMDVCTSPFILIMMVIVILQLLDYGIFSMELREHSSSQWSPPIWVVKMLLPVGAIMLGMQCLAEIVRDFYKAVTGKELKNAPD